MGDSVAAGEGAVPVTNGYVYQLYERSTFGEKQQTDFANTAVRGARSWELRDQQVAQVLCAEPAQRPTVVTITAGANDFLRGDSNILAIAARVTEGINLLLNNGTVVGSPVLTRSPGSRVAAANVTILVSNYYTIPHPVPAMFQLTRPAWFRQALRYWLQFTTCHRARESPSSISRRPRASKGATSSGARLHGPFDFDIHPTNLGHSFIAHEFEAVWQGLP
jgi:lysophospholipase L1-like esterase